jgi:hypothetical protein
MMVDQSLANRIDWDALAATVGTLRVHGESAGSDAARQALELIIGTANICEAVDHYVLNAPGAELVRQVLWQIRPWSAMQRCFEIYSQSESIDSRRKAVELLRVVSDARVLSWLDGFLDDPDCNIQYCGAAIVDQLLWSSIVQPEKCRHVLAKMADHSNSAVRAIQTTISSRQSSCCDE